MTSFVLIAGLLAAVLVLVRVIIDPRRPSTGIFLVAALVLLWLAAATAIYRANEDLGRLLGFGTVFIGVPLVALIGGAALMANGAIVSHREGVRVATLLAPVVGAGLLAVLAAGFVLVGGTGQTFPTWVAVLAAVVVVLGALVTVQLVAYWLYAQLYARIVRNRPVEVVTVLGAGLSGDKVTPLLASRLDRAIEVYRHQVARGRHPHIVTSGGQGADELVSEADAMADYLESAGIDAAVILRETASTTTEENLQFTKQLLTERGVSWNEMAVVTSEFHVLRTASLTRALNMSAHVIGARTALYYVPSAFLREFAALLVHYRRINVAIALACVSLVLVVGVFA